jgi:hypothetical protein
VGATQGAFAGVAEAGVHGGDGTDVIVDAEDLLDDHERTAGRGVGIEAEGGDRLAVGGGEGDVGHDADDARRISRR